MTGEPIFANISWAPHGHSGFFRKCSFKETYTVGYYDDDKDILYRWKGFVLAEKDVITSVLQSGLVINGEKFRLVIPVDPPVHYIFDKTKTGRVGYLDRSFRRFFQWKGIEIKREEMLPADEKGKHAVLEFKYDFSSIVEVDPPKHQLDQPRRWKKVPDGK